MDSVRCLPQRDLDTLQQVKDAQVHLAGTGKQQMVLTMGIVPNGHHKAIALGNDPFTNDVAEDRNDHQHTCWSL